MKCPTEAQVRWFWEQCGFRLFTSEDAKRVGGHSTWWIGRWVIPQNKRKFEYFEQLPDIHNLNDLFKRAVPEFAVIQFSPVSDGLCCLICHNGEWYSSKADKGEYAAALFWAYFKVLGDKK